MARHQVYSGLKTLRDLLLILGIVYTAINFNQVKAFARTKFDDYLTQSICDTPIPYKIGKVDSRFGLSAGEFSADTSQAAHIWQKVGGGKKLFIEDNSEQTKLTVNLIFDQRSSLKNQINQMEGQVSQKNQSLQSDIGSYKQQDAEFKQKLIDFNSQVDTLNQQINSWNEKGGAPPDIYQQLKTQQDDLIQEQNTLRSEADTLNQTAKKLNLSTQDYNSEVDQLNNTISNFGNQLVKKPEEGLFDPNTNIINIYFDNSQAELIHTLAHEMGHALGLEHNPNPKSIMYPYSTQTIMPSETDIASLNTVCERRVLNVPLLNNAAQKFNLNIQDF